MTLADYIINYTNLGITLTPTDKEVIAVLLSLGADTPDGANITNQGLADMVGLPKTMTNKSKAKLLDAGILSKQRHMYLPCTFRIHAQPLGSVVDVQNQPVKRKGLVEGIVAKQAEAKKVNQLREETVTSITLMKDKVDAEALIQMIEVLEHSRKPVVVGVEVKESIKNEVGARVEYTFKKQPIDHDAMRQYALRRLAIVNVEYISVLANTHVNGQSVEAIRGDIREAFTELMHKMVTDGELVYADQRKKKVTLP